MALDRQIQILSVDTGNFYSNHELYLHKLNHKIRVERNELKPLLNKYEELFINNGLTQDDISRIQNGNIDEIKYPYSIKNELDKYIKLYKAFIYKGKKAKETKNKLLTLLENKTNANIQSNGKHNIRELRFFNKDKEPNRENIISVFDSSFTRMIGAKQDELSEDFMVVQVYYFSIIKNLIYYGFTYKGEKYIYFTSSAGQIRTKKTVFIKESVWKKYEKTIMCGLTIDDINKKGGNNPNKHLAYMALSNSATDVWEEFDIDKTIVVDDFETDVFGTYDLVDDVDYSIKRVSDYVPISHTDGAGMMLPCMGKNRMVRLPWVKGLLGVFDFNKFIQVNNCSPIIKDIYGVEHNVIEEDIQIIFTKSQFKMWKYYDSWERYKKLYKQYNCTAGYTNIEEDRIKDASINYQMLQTLTDITDEEILDIASSSIDRLNRISSSIEDIQFAFGVSPYNLDKTAFQKSIELYPNLLNDEYVKSQLREIKDSMIKKFKAGKLRVYGKYTFLLPDFYAACQYWFMGIKEPEGLLEDGEVFCWLFRKSNKLDCLRSPHLYMEHAIRKNVACNEYGDRQKLLREWYGTDAVYTSCHDIISKILQFDVDGDKSLVLADKTIIKVAERNIEKFDIVPLYYNMRKAEPSMLNNINIYNGLNAAFTGGNIGIYSNNISKIWNSDIFINGTLDEKIEAINVIKLLCMENNFVIDYAKTLYKPERPDYIDDLISKYTNSALPYFFKYAKDKEERQVTAINNSLVNKLNDIIPNPRINCRKLGLGSIDYKLLMNNPNIECKVEFTDKGKLIKEKTDPLIVKYYELNKKYGYAINNAKNVDKSFSYEILKNSKLRQDLRYKKIYTNIKEELSLFGYSDIEITDILVKFLYGVKESKHKMVLWLCYGDYIYENLKTHLKYQFKDIQCVDCGEWLKVSVKDNKTCMCPNCYEEYRKKYKSQKEKERRNRLRGQNKIDL